MTTARDQFDREFEAFLADEESRVASLYRKLPRPEPDPRLDAAVRSMAHRALNPQLVATPRSETRRRRARWLPVFGAAAGIVFAAGIAWRVETARRSESDQLAAPSKDVISVRQLDAPPPPPAEPPLSPAPPPPETAATLQAARMSGKAENTAAPVLAELPKSAAAAVHEKPAAKVADQEEDRPTAAAGGILSKTQAAAKAAPAPQAFPVQAQKRASEMDAVERKQIMAAGAWQNLHDHDTGDAAKNSAKLKSLDDKKQAAAALAQPVPPPPAAQETTKTTAESTATRETPASALTAAAVTRAAPPPRDTALPMAAAPRADAAGKVAGDEANIPGADSARRESAAARLRSTDPNASLYPEHWLENIRMLLKQERRDEAVRSLAEFRKMYPAYHLPDDLRDLK